MVPSKYLFIDGVSMSSGTRFIISSGPWTPANITTLAWYDASDADTITEAAGNVSQWDDKSGNARHAVQGTGANQPSWNSVDTVTATSSEVMTVPSEFVFANGEADIYWVGKMGTQTELPILGTSKVGSSARYYPCAAGRGAYKNRMGCWIRNAAGSERILYNFLTGTSTFNNGQHMYLCRDTGTAITGYYDAVAQNTAFYTRAGTFDMDNTILFYQPTTYNEMVITSNLTDADREKMEGYLAWKWGLESNLPALHPYKSEAP